MFLSLTGSQKSWNTCSLQFELPRENLHWFTSFHWLNCIYASLKCYFAFYLNTTWYYEYVCLCKPMKMKREICLALTSQKILIVLHQVWGQHQGVVGVEGWLQLIPLWSPAPKCKSTMRLTASQALFFLTQSGQHSVTWLESSRPLDRCWAPKVCHRWSFELC